MKRILLSALLLFISSASFSSQAVLLVSLGMPDNALMAYLKQGHQYHIPVVIRGLYTAQKDQSSNPYIGSFSDTANRVKQLIRKSKGGGVSINPLLFRAFDIKAVPALVIYDDGMKCIKQTAHASNHSCNKNTFDVIFGNVPIDKLLTIIANQSQSADRSNYAKVMLEKHGNFGAIS